MTEQELLKVLDLPEWEQRKWFWIHTITDSIYSKKDLANLAFRLRDEAEEFELICGIEKVFQYCCSPEEYDFAEDAYKWFATEAKPIHWIIAALIAKEQKDVF